MRWGAEEDGPLHGLRILVADDEIIIALDLETTLREAGAEVVGPCTTLAATLQAADAEHLSAAVLDLRLGRQTTEPVADRLANRGVPFLFYTGQNLPDELRSRLPQAPVVTKPAPQWVLVQTVLRILHH